MDHRLVQLAYFFLRVYFLITATHVTQCACVCERFLYALPTVSGCGPNESAGGVLGDLVPVLFAMTEVCVTHHGHPSTINTPPGEHTR